MDVPNSVPAKREPRKVAVTIITHWPGGTCVRAGSIDEADAENIELMPAVAGLVQMTVPRA